MARQDDFSQVTNPEMQGSFAALKRAAAQARPIAIQTNTAIVIMVDGKMVRKTAAELLDELSEAILDPSHAEHESTLEWHGGPFDPNEFETGLANLRLSHSSRLL